MTDTQLTELYHRLLQEFFRYSGYKANASFYETRTLNHSIRLKRKTIHVRLSHHFRHVPQRIHAILGIILIAKLFKRRVDKILRREYDDYVEQHILPYHKPRRQSLESRYHPRGTYFDLSTMFDDVNRRFFGGRLHKPHLGWSVRDSRSRLGFYSSDRDLLVISRIFDRPNTPRHVVEYMLYHEMLHIYLPAEKVNGRRRVHTAEFRRLEKQFPQYEAVQHWIGRNRHR